MDVLYHHEVLYRHAYEQIQSVALLLGYWHGDSHQNNPGFRFKDEYVYASWLPLRWLDGTFRGPEVAE